MTLWNWTNWERFVAYEVNPARFGVWRFGETAAFEKTNLFRKERSKGWRSSDHWICRDSTGHGSRMFPLHNAFGLLASLH